VAFDFLFGGAIVAGALFLASLLGPVFGGILAGAPIRAGGTVFLQALHQGEASAIELTRGVVLAMVANVGFALALFACLPRLGLYASFLVAGVVFVVLVAALMKLT